MSADIIYLRDHIRNAPVNTPIRWYGWRLAWTFQVWPVVGFVPVWVLDWP